MTGGTCTRSVCSSIHVRPYLPSDRDRWDEFISRCPEATFFHRIGWLRVITEGLGHQCHYLLAERDGVVEGILPLALVRSHLFGRGLVSTPCCVYGGVAAMNDEARQVLTDHSVCLADQLRVDSLQLRNRAAVRPDWPTQDIYVTFRKSISERDDDNLLAIPRKQRAMIRKGVAAGLTAFLTNDVDRFYRIYAASVRNLGTPVFPRRFFATLADEFAFDIEMSIVATAGQEIAAVMSFYFRDEVLPYYGGSLPAARALKGNDFMYWDLMTRAAARGARIFDFGRSKSGSGSYDFKKNWGFRAQTLHYEHKLVRARTIPEHNPNNPRYRFFIAAWRHLPLPIANAIGPLLARNLG